MVRVEQVACDAQAVGLGGVLEFALEQRALGVQRVDMLGQPAAQHRAPLLGPPNRPVVSFGDEGRGERVEHARRAALLRVVELRERYDVHLDDTPVALIDVDVRRLRHVRAGRLNDGLRGCQQRLGGFRAARAAGDRSHDERRRHEPGRQRYAGAQRPLGRRDGRGIVRTGAGVQRRRERRHRRLGLR